jgi:hypothetical protein
MKKSHNKRPLSTYVRHVHWVQVEKLAGVKIKTEVAEEWQVIESKAGDQLNVVSAAFKTEAEAFAHMIKLSGESYPEIQEVFSLMM